MDNKQRPSGAAPLGSRAFYEKTNPYWIQQAASRKPKRKRSSLTNKK
jgi:hypothetical protein